MVQLLPCAYPRFEYSLRACCRVRAVHGGVLAATVVASVGVHELTTLWELHRGAHSGASHCDDSGVRSGNCSALEMYLARARIAHECQRLTKTFFFFDSPVRYDKARAAIIATFI